MSDEKKVEKAESEKKVEKAESEKKVEKAESEKKPEVATKAATPKKEKIVKKERSKQSYKPKERQKLLQRFLALRKSGTPVEEAAKKLGVPYVTLHYWENASKAQAKAALSAPKKHRKRTPKPKKQPVAEKKSGVIEILTKMGVIRCQNARDAVLVLNEMAARS